MVLYDDVNQQYDVGDLYAIKFVTFYLPGHRPGQVRVDDGAAAQAAPTFAPMNYPSGRLCQRARQYERVTAKDANKKTYPCLCRNSTCSNSVLSLYFYVTENEGIPPFRVV